MAQKPLEGVWPAVAAPYSCSILMAQGRTQRLPCTTKTGQEMGTASVHYCDRLLPWLYVVEQANVALDLTWYFPLCQAPVKCDQ